MYHTKCTFPHNNLSCHTIETGANLHSSVTRLPHVWIIFSITCPPPVVLYFVLSFALQSIHDTCTYNHPHCGRRLCCVILLVFFASHNTSYTKQLNNHSNPISNSKPLVSVSEVMVRTLCDTTRERWQVAQLHAQQCWLSNIHTFQTQQTYDTYALHTTVSTHLVGLVSLYQTLFLNITQTKPPETQQPYYTYALHTKPLVSTTLLPAKFTN